VICPAVQRWRDRRDSYRPASEPIDPKQFEVASIPDDTTARAFVQRHHYAGTYPAARFRHALYDRRGRLVGVAVFSHPTNNRTLTNVFPGAATDAVELGRFVLLDSVPANGETWFLARCFELLRRDVVGVVSFSDPVPRTSLGGDVIFPGHLGTIYQAKSAVFLGRGSPGTLRLLPDGRVLSNRALSKIRVRDQGWRYGVELLERAGAAPLAANDNAADWLATWLPRLTRPLSHPGNLKYAFPLERAARRALPPSLPYPKVRAPFQMRLLP